MPKLKGKNSLRGTMKRYPETAPMSSRAPEFYPCAVGIARLAIPRKNLFLARRAVCLPIAANG
jgi:hypothetical protein